MAMNVLELLTQELKNKNWSIDEKAYYIYIRSCQLFSYDPRYQFCELTLEGRMLEEKIRNRKIDLENVHNSQVICSSYSKEVFSKLVKELLNIDVEDLGSSHVKCTFYDGKRDMLADATITSDLARVKMGLSTNGYRPVTKDYIFPSELKNIAKTIHYIEEEYTDSYLEKQQKSLFDDFLKDSYPEILPKESDDFLIYRLHRVKEIFEKFQFPNFSDANFCIFYLIHKFSDVKEKKIKTVSLYQNFDEDNWEFMNVYPVCLQNDMLYFMLKQGYKGFDFYKISEEDAFQYAKQFKGIGKDKLHRSIGGVDYGRT